MTPGARVRHTGKGITGSVDPDAVSAGLASEYPDLVPVQWDHNDAWLVSPRVLEVVVTSNTKKPEPRWQPVSGVIPTLSKENEMSTTLPVEHRDVVTVADVTAMTKGQTLTIDAEHLTVAHLDALPANSLICLGDEAAWSGCRAPSWYKRGRDRYYGRGDAGCGLGDCSAAWLLENMFDSGTFTLLAGDGEEHYVLATDVDRLYSYNEGTLISDGVSKWEVGPPMPRPAPVFIGVSPDVKGQHAEAEDLVSTYLTLNSYDAPYDAPDPEPEPEAPQLPNRPRWATKSDESPQYVGDGRWSHEFTGDAGTVELSERLEHTHETGWTVADQLGVFLPQIDNAERDLDFLRANAADILRAADIIEANARPVGTEA